MDGRRLYRAILEAALSGCALVLGDIPSLRELWRNRALFVPPDDPEALEHAILRLIEEPDRRSSLAAGARDPRGDRSRTSPPGAPMSNPLAIFEDVIELIMNNYVETIDTNKVMAGAMHGLADGLDPDSAYLDVNQAKAYEKNEASGSGRTGIELTRNYYLRVIAARDGSPAARAGLRPGDYIRAIDGMSTRDASVYEGMRLLNGKPGTKVSLTVLRGNAAEPHEVAVVRDRLTGPELTSRMANPSTGYVRIVDFTANSSARIKQAVDALAKTGASRYVIDLRGTSRGDLDMGVEASRLFVRSGTLTVKVSRDPAARPDAKDKTRKDAVTAQASDGAVAAPVVLLVDSGTAGAAELFAAALDGNNRADLVGERTIGRAARQQLAIGNVRDLMAALRLVHVVGGDEHGGSLVGQAGDEVPELPPRQRVDAGGRLGEDEEGRPVEEGHGHGQALLPAAGEGPGQRLRLPAQAGALDHLAQARLAPGAGEPVHAGEEAQVLAHGEVLVEREALGHVAGLALNRLRLAREVEAEHLAMAAVRSQQPAEHAQAGGLARAVGAEDGGDGLRGDLEGESVDGRLVAVPHHEVVDDHGGRQGRRHRMSLGSLDLGSREVVVEGVLRVTNACGTDGRGCGLRPGLV